MSSQRFKKVIIDDVQNSNIAGREESALLDLAEYAIKSQAVTLSRKAFFYTDDFRSADRENIPGYEIMIERRKHDGGEFWIGEITKADQRLRIQAHLE